MVLQLAHEPLTRRANLVVLIELTAPKAFQAADPHKGVEGIAKGYIDVLAQGFRIDRLRLNAKAVQQFILPFVLQRRRADDEQAPRVAARLQLFPDVNRGYGLPEADFVSDQQPAAG
jgi:hypothetical protein